MMTSCTLACRAFAQGDVGQDFGGAAEDGRVAIHRGVAGAQADVVRAELAAQRQPLLVHQRLDRAGIDRALALGDGLEMQRRRHERFARAGGRVQDDVLLLEQLQDGLLLRRIEREPPALGVIEKAPQQHIVAGVIVPRESDRRVSLTRRAMVLARWGLVCCVQETGLQGSFPSRSKVIHQEPHVGLILGAVGGLLGC